MTPFKRGDIVTYVFPKSPEWHGVLAIVDKWEASEEHPDFPIWILAYISFPTSFPYAVYDGTPWHKTAWEKVGHLDGI